jgi:hypothetical protein
MEKNFWYCGIPKAWIGISPQVQFFKEILNLEISEEFIYMGGEKLKAFFESEVGTSIGEWYISPFPEKKEDLSLIGKITIFETKLINQKSMKIYPIKIAWKSKVETNNLLKKLINGNEFDFWFYEFNPNEFKEFLSGYVFWYYLGLEFSFLKILEIKISKKYLIIAGKKLFDNFVKHTSISDKKNIIIAFPLKDSNMKFEVFILNEVSKVNWYLVVLASLIPVTICWKSKSGRIYKISDEDIDENDIEFWFEDLDVLAIYKELYPNNPLPFKLKNIQFELEILRLDLELELKIDLKDANLELIDLIETQVENFIDKWNKKAEKDTEDKLGMGLVHNTKTSLKSNCEIIFAIDMGSSDVAIIKKIIMMLNKTEGIKKVTIS